MSLGVKNGEFECKTEGKKIEIFWKMKKLPLETVRNVSDKLKKYYGETVRNVSEIIKKYYGETVRNVNQKIENLLWRNGKDCE